MSENLKVAVIGAGGKMGQRVSANLEKKVGWKTYFCENGEKGIKTVEELGRKVTPTDEIISEVDVAVLAVPDIALGPVTADVAPKMKPGAMILTLDPAAAYANLLTVREDLAYAVAHPTHPSLFLERTSKEEWADTFGGVAAAQYSMAALQQGNESDKKLATEVIETIYAPVIKVHWVSLHDLAVLEPTLAETIGCMLGQFCRDALDYCVEVTDMTTEQVEAMFFGHMWIALTNGLRGSNPFSDACLLAMDYGRNTIIKDDWKKVFQDEDLDKVLCKMLKLDKIER